VNAPFERCRVGAVVLAAGASSRLGRAKQLVVHEGHTLLERTIVAAVAAAADPVVVVLGAAANEIRRALPPLEERVRFVVNDQWPDGMGTSIARGVAALREFGSETEAALILVCDQPALDAGVLRRFVELACAKPGMILLADYGTGRGPPVTFPREFFDELVALRGEAGAREVHRRHADSIITVPFPGGAVDIDAPDDLRSLRP
jgi:molybdenum cofactor cytidylyltransferase